MDFRDDSDDLLEGMDMTMKGIDVETKGSVSTDLNTYSFRVDVEVPGKKIVIP